MRSLASKHRHHEVSDDEAELDLQTVESVMSASMASVHEDDPVDVLRDLFTDNRNVGVTVLGRDGRAIGYITPRDLAASKAATIVGDAMRPLVVTVTTKTPVISVEELMHFEHISYVPVVDHRGHVVGIVSAPDA